MSEYEKIIHLKVEFEPLKVYETLKVEYEVTFGDYAHPADPDELQINNVKRLSSLFTTPSVWADIYGPGIARGLLQDLVDTLLDDTAVRADLIEEARAHEQENSFYEDETFNDNADYLYDRHRDRSLEA